MKHVEISEWESENKADIIGWEIHYGYKNENKEWVWYDGFKMIIFEMKDKTKKEFKQENMPI